MKERRRRTNGDTAPASGSGQVPPRGQQRAFLTRVARAAMIERGLEPEFPPPALAEAERMTETIDPSPGAADLRELLWCSIDNDDSRDLDQLTAAEPLPGGAARILVAVADVDARVEPGSALNDHAETNTTSVYTPSQIFPMLPDRLSGDLTSLIENHDRLAVVVGMTIDAAGGITAVEVRHAIVRNRAKLAYPSTGAWLEGEGPMPEKIRAVPGLDESLRLQNGVAQRLKERRHEQGALDLESLEVRALLEDDAVSALQSDRRNRARDLIEDFMIAVNGAIARFLEERRFPVLRRVLRSPERWARIVDLAEEEGGELPDQPDAVALDRFLLARRAADPVRFPDLSLSVIKLLGNGEYAASFPGESATGHFGLAVSDYTHSTAPNRRYPDVITQRLLKAALAGRPVPYADDQLVALATQCTAKEDAAQKVERLMRKAAAACLLSGRIGDHFDGIVTGASAKGTWVRVFDPPVEGRIMNPVHGTDVGDRVQVTLTHTNPERGFIDFSMTGSRPRGRSRGRGNRPG